MRVLVCGGRDYKDHVKVLKTLDLVAGMAQWPRDAYIPMPPPGFVLMHGGAAGADWLAEQWCVANGVKPLVFKADWKAHGPGAGPIRNQQMLVEGKPMIVVAFPGGRGTADMVRRAVAAGVTVWSVQ